MPDDRPGPGGPFDSLFERLFENLESTLGDAMPRPDRPTRGNGARGARTPQLDRYGRDLTADAAQGRLDPVIGRDAEIEQVLEVLARRTKNNPVLVGDPGVGKTAIVEGIAQRVVDGRGARRAARRAGGLGRPGRHGRGHQVPRRVRAADDRGDRRGGRGRPRHRAVRRRAAHGGRGRLGRGRADGRRVDPQARARPRRPADDRGDHGRRVPPPHREGPGAGAPVRAGARSPSRRWPATDRDPARAAPRATRRTTTCGSTTPRWSRRPS